MIPVPAFTPTSPPTAPFPVTFTFSRPTFLIVPALLLNKPTYSKVVLFIVRFFITNPFPSNVPPNPLEPPIGTKSATETISISFINIYLPERLSFIFRRSSAVLITV